MTNAAPKRFRPRFSIRTLIIFVTLVCCYLGLWEATKTWGVADVRETQWRQVTQLRITLVSRSMTRCMSCRQRRLSRLSHF